MLTRCKNVVAELVDSIFNINNKPRIGTDFTVQNYTGTVSVAKRATPVLGSETATLGVD